MMEQGWLDKFLNLLPTTPVVLDVGCGSGEPIGEYLINRRCDVTGIDSAPEMIDLCKERFPTCTWQVSDMRSLSLGRRFDGIIAWDSFFHLRADDQRRMFPIFRAHVKPSATLLFTSGPSHGEAVGSFEGDPLYHASLGGEEYQTLLAGNGFVVTDHVVEDPNCGGHTVWLAKVV
jgi:SAM-dependent methyltransferase